MDELEAELQELLEDESEAGKRELSPLLIALAALLGVRTLARVTFENEADIAELTQVMGSQLAIRYYRLYELSAMLQIGVIDGVFTEATGLVGGRLANRYSAMAVERALEVLARREEARTQEFLDSYAELIDSQLTYTAGRDGTEVGARMNGATRKRLVRLAPVRAPRDHHDALVGTELDIDEPFEIAGVMVQNFGDDALPLEEVIGCKHGCVYF